MSDLGEIERDGSREYIPLPGGWEIQTKGSGSSYRLLDKKSDERHNILSADAPFIYDFVTRMAKEVHEASAKAAAELTSLREQCEAKDAELREIGAILGTQFMDPPDGGDVPIHEQVRRAKAEIERLKSERDEARHLLDAYLRSNKRVANKMFAENERLRKALEKIDKLEISASDSMVNQVFRLKNTARDALVSANDGT